MIFRKFCAPNLLSLNFSVGNVHPKLFPEPVFMTNMGEGNIFLLLGQFSINRETFPHLTGNNFPHQQKKEKEKDFLVEKENLPDLPQIFNKYCDLHVIIRKEFSL